MGIAGVARLQTHHTCWPPARNGRFTICLKWHAATLRHRHWILVACSMVMLGWSSPDLAQRHRSRCGRTVPETWSAQKVLVVERVSSGLSKHQPGMLAPRTRRSLAVRRVLQVALALPKHIWRYPFALKPSFCRFSSRRHLRLCSRAIVIIEECQLPAQSVRSENDGYSRSIEKNITCD